MSNIVRTNLEKTLSVKSLSDLVRAKASELVELLLDCSGSMGAPLKNGKARIDGLREVVKEIQSQRETKMIQFGVGYEPSYIFGTVPNPGGSTPLTQAIDFARTSGAGRLVVISDGIPDNTATALEAAGRFGGQIDVVFVGDEGESGEAFLRELAAKTGGTSFTGKLTEVKELSGKIMGLLTGGDEDDDE